MRLLLPSVTFAQERAAVAEAERVIVTGSNIPTAEEVGPNPVDTYRPADIEKLGVRNSTDFLTNLPQEMGGNINQNIDNGGDGSVIPNLRGSLPKETLVLIDGKRVATTGLSGAGVNGTTLTLGMQNVFDSDPPFVAGAFENNYDESLATIKGRFWYVQLRKRF